MNWRSNKKFSVALLQANFQKNGLTVKNPKKSSKEISVRDHSDYKRYQKMYAIKNVLLFITNFYGNRKIF